MNADRETIPFLKVHRLIDVIEWVIKWHTLLALTDLLRQQDMAARMKLLLATGLRTPSLGTWMLFYREAIACNPSPGVPLFDPERLIGIEDRHQLVAVRNRYAHGATPHRGECERDCERLIPVVSEIVGLPALTKLSLVASGEGGALRLVGDRAESSVVDLPVGHAGVVSSDRPDRLVLDLWPLGAYLEEPTGRCAGRQFYFYNALRREQVEEINYEFAILVRSRELWEPFHERFPLPQWLRTNIEGADVFRARIEALTEGFRGRANERSRLRGFCRDGAGTLLVSGVPGIGKSALLARVIRECRAEVDADTRTSEEAAPDIVEYFVKRGTPTADVNAFLRLVGAHLDRLFGLKGFVGGATTQELSESLRARLSAVDSLPDPRRVVLFVDGLDEGPAIARHVPQSRSWLVVLAAGRSNPDVDAFASSRDRARFDELSLGPLSRSEVRSLLYDAADKYHPRFDDSWVDAITARSQGNPLYLTLLCNQLLAGEHLIGDVDAVPREMDRLFEEVMDRVSGGGRDQDVLDVLHLLVHARSSLSPTVAADLLDCGTAIVERAVQRCREILARQDDDERVPAFHLFHETLREYLLDRHGRDCGHMLRRLGERCGRWGDLEVRGARTYALAHGARHQWLADDAEGLWELLTDQEYREAQRSTFRQFGPALDALNGGIRYFANRADPSANDDARLCWCALETARLAHTAIATADEAFEWVEDLRLDDDRRIDAALDRIQVLDEGQFLRGALRILSTEVARQGARVDRAPAGAGALRVLEAIEDRIPPGSGTVDWSLQLSAEYVVWIVARATGLWSDLPVTDLLLRTSDLEDLARLLMDWNRDGRQPAFDPGVALLNAAAACSAIEDEESLRRILGRIVQRLPDVADRDAKRSVLEALDRRVTGMRSVSDRARALASVVRGFLAMGEPDAACRRMDTLGEDAIDLLDELAVAEVLPEVVDVIARLPDAAERMRRLDELLSGADDRQWPLSAAEAFVSALVALRESADPGEYHDAFLAQILRRAGLFGTDLKRPVQADRPDLVDDILYVSRFSGFYPEPRDDNPEARRLTSIAAVLALASESSGRLEHVLGAVAMARGGRAGPGRVRTKARVAGALARGGNTIRAVALLGEAIDEVTDEDTGQIFSGALADCVESCRYLPSGLRRSLFERALAVTASIDDGDFRSDVFVRFLETTSPLAEPEVFLRVAIAAVWSAQVEPGTFRTAEHLPQLARSACELDAVDGRIALLTGAIEAATAIPNQQQRNRICGGIAWSMKPALGERGMPEAMLRLVWDERDDEQFEPYYAFMTRLTLVRVLAECGFWRLALSVSDDCGPDWARPALYSAVLAAVGDEDVEVARRCQEIAGTPIPEPLSVAVDGNDLDSLAVRLAVFCGNRAALAFLVEPTETVDSKVDETQVVLGRVQWWQEEIAKEVAAKDCAGIDQGVRRRLSWVRREVGALELIQAGREGDPAASTRTSRLVAEVLHDGLSDAEWLAFEGDDRAWLLRATRLVRDHELDVDLLERAGTRRGGGASVHGPSTSLLGAMTETWFSLPADRQGTAIIDFMIDEIGHLTEPEECSACVEAIFLGGGQRWSTPAGSKPLERVLTALSSREPEGLLPSTWVLLGEVTVRAGDAQRWVHVFERARLSLSAGSYGRERRDLLGRLTGTLVGGASSPAVESILRAWISELIDTLGDVAALADLDVVVEALARGGKLGRFSDLAEHVGDRLYKLVDEDGDHQWERPRQLCHAGSILAMLGHDSRAVRLLDEAIRAYEVSSLGYSIRGGAVPIRVACALSRIGDHHAAADALRKWIDDVPVAPPGHDTRDVCKQFTELILDTPALPERRRLLECALTAAQLEEFEIYRAHAFEELVPAIVRVSGELQQNLPHRPVMDALETVGDLHRKNVLEAVVDDLERAGASPGMERLWMGLFRWAQGVVQDSYRADVLKVLASAVTRIGQPSLVEDCLSDDSLGSTWGPTFLRIWRQCLLEHDEPLPLIRRSLARWSSEALAASEGVRALMNGLASAGLGEQVDAIISTCPDLGLDWLRASRREHANLHDWLGQLADPDDRADVKSWARRVDKRRMSAAEFTRRVDELFHEV